ncbi:MAG: DNA polymerase III subunit gamma and tau [Trueperella sp.]|nr:DNA polymerase III subunit gamma and tau [Trueperella sp.]
MSIALYRRYRPQTFDEVIGQEHVVKPLKSALAAGRTTHAYLFSGPRGCGKTTSARILARALNCAEYPTDTPCGNCDSCRELSRDGSGSLDVVELDAASHGGVDDARELREQAGFAPVRDRFKIYIIDEAHMVSKQGFNALLKLVEEPPEHVKFIFATTEPEKVIETVRSRTHHYPFRLVPPADLEKYLALLCAQENVSAGHDVLSLVVRAGGGSVRDTLSVLDQIIGGSDGTKLDYERVVGLLGFTSAHLLDDAVTAIATGSGKELFRVVDAVIKSGHDPRRFVEDLLQRLRDLVIISLTGAAARDVFVAVPDDQYDRMAAQAEQLGPKRASHCADLTSAALSEMVGATAPRLQLELLCARLLVADLPNVPLPPAPAPASVPARDLDMVDPRHRPMPQLPGTANSQPTPPPEPASARSSAAVPASASASAAESGAVSPIQQRWQELITDPGLSRVVQSQLEQSVGPVGLAAGVLQIGFAQPGLVAAFNRRSHGEFAAVVSRALGQQLAVTAVTVDANSGSNAAGGSAPEPPASERPTPPAAVPPVPEARIVPPKVEAAPVAAETDDPPADSPCAQLLPDGADPAGILAQLIDGNDLADASADLADTSDEPTDTGAELADTEPEIDPENAPIPAPVDTPVPAPAPATPFYAQNMPAVPPATFPGDTAIAAGAPVTATGGAVTATSGIALAASSTAAGAPAPSTPPEYDETEEVSPEDPEISQSQLVGISVVLNKLSGTVVETRGADGQITEGGR